MKKNKSEGNYLTEKVPIKHFLLIMRTTLILLFTCVFCSMAEVSYTQNARVTINKRNVTLKEVLNEIENQTDYLFIYSNEVNTNKKVSVRAKEKAVSEVLSSLLEDKDINYSMEGNHIILSTIERVNTPEKETIAAVQQQKKTITGTVKDQNGEPIIGANIIEVGTTNGTVTDMDGNFTLSVAPDANIRITYVGYIEQVINTEGRQNFSITLEEDVYTLQEVVAVGYGMQRKENLTGAVASISGEQIEAVPSTNVATALSGRLPGAIIIQGTGEPGLDDARILVRGRTTLGGNTAPLIVIDGIPDRSLYEIDPNDIESISILKDASAAIYGAQAANGVILVTTKSGSSRKLVSYSFNQGFKTPTILPEVASAAEYAQYISDYQDYEGQARLYSDRDIELFKSGVDPWEHPNTDWMDDLVRQWANQSHHNLSLSGALKDATYYASFGYRNDEAMYEQESTNYKQYNLRLKLDIPATDWLKFGVSYGGFKTSKKFPTTGSYYLVGWATMALPTQPSFWPTGEPGPDFEGGVNPVVNTSFEAGYDKQDNFKNEITFSGSFTPKRVKGLSIDGFFTYDVNNGYRKFFKKPWTLYYADWDSAVRNSEGFITSMDLIPMKRGLESPELTETNSKSIREMLNISAKYDRDFGDHTFSIFGAFEQIDDSASGFDAFRRNYISDLVQTLSAGGEKDKTNSGWASIYARQSWIGRFNYDYKDKYLFEFIFRRDGSLKFPPESRWGNFPAVLFAWRASEEDFWKNNISVIDYFKLRTSFGQMGMDPGDPFQYINKYSLAPGMTFGVDKVVNTKIYQSIIANPNITWEKQSTFNVGFDSNILNRLFHLNAEFFYNKRTDILARRNASVPAFTGLALPLENIATVDNRGLEIDAGYHKKVNTDFSIDVNGNFSWNRNKVVFMDEPEKPVPWQVQTGHPYGTHLVYNAIGIFKTQEEVDNYPHWPGAKPGDVIFEDVSGDGKITSDDRILLDKTDAPEIFYGIGVDLNYKNWTLSLLGQGQGTYYKMAIEGNRGIGQNVFKWMATDYWTPENNTSDKARPFHRADQYWSYLSNPSTYWYDNMAYFRLKNIMLGYNLPNEITHKIGLSNVNLYLSAYNPFLLYSAQRNYDPEVGNPQTYPAMKTFSFGAKIDF
jgi:TonB-linked SusC/RagA family outer membrane protein